MKSSFHVSLYSVKKKFPYFSLYSAKLFFSMKDAGNVVFYFSIYSANLFFHERCRECFIFYFFSNKKMRTSFGSFKITKEFLREENVQAILLGPLHSEVDFRFPKNKVENMKNVFCSFKVFRFLLRNRKLGSLTKFYPGSTLSNSFLLS